MWSHSASTFKSNMAPTVEKEKKSSIFSIGVGEGVGWLENWNKRQPLFICINGIVGWLGGGFPTGWLLWVVQVRWAALTGYASEAPIILLINMISQRTTKSHSGNRGSSSSSSTDFSSSPGFLAAGIICILCKFSVPGGMWQMFRRIHRTPVSHGSPSALCLFTKRICKWKVLMFFKKLPKINNIKMRKMVAQMEMENSTKCIFTACYRRAPKAG